MLVLNFANRTTRFSEVSMRRGPSIRPHRLLFVLVALFAFGLGPAHGAPCDLEDGLVRLAEGDYAGAAADFTRVLENDPQSVEALEARARAYLMLGKEMLALGDLQKLVAGVQPWQQKAYWQVLTSEEAAHKVAPDLEKLPLAAVVAVVATYATVPSATADRTMTDMGTGVVVSEDGYVAAAYGLIEGAVDISVAFADGRVADARFIGSDPWSRLALVKLSASDGPYPFAPLADRGKEIGDPGLVVSLRLSPEPQADEVSVVDVAVTPAIVAGCGLDGFMYGLNMFDLWEVRQLAAADPAASSALSPVFDRSGRLIGFSVLDVAGLVAGAPAVDAVVRALQDDGTVPSPGLIGVELQTVAADAGTNDGADAPQGARIVRLVAGGQAAREGLLRVGDIVTAVNGEAISGHMELIRTVSKLIPGTQAVLALVRDGEAQELAVTVGARAMPYGDVGAKVRPYLRKADSYLEASQFELAAARYGDAIALDGQADSAWVGRATAYVATGEYDAAITDCRSAIELDPGNAEAYGACGDAYFGKMDIDTAGANYQKAIALDSGFAGTHARYSNNFCWSLAFDDRAKEALNYCNISLHLRPDHIDTLDGRAFAYLKLGEYDEAIANYNLALALDPNFASSLHGRGLAKRSQGDQAGAEADFAAALAINPRIAEEYAFFGVE